MDIIFNMDTTYEDIMLAMLNRSGETVFTARFATGETMTFNRNEMPDNIITKCIESKVQKMREDYENAVKRLK